MIQMSFKCTDTRNLLSGSSISKTDINTRKTT
jgi:hypothetical protein